MKLISLGRVVGMGALGLAVAAVACTTADDGDGEGDGNTTGGATGSGGTTNGTGGAGNGDAGAGNGSGGTTAGACTTPEASAVPSAPPPAALITDFSEPCVDEMDMPTGQACFGLWPNFYGGTWAPYPEGDLEGGHDADNEQWTISGEVATYAGFGVWFRDAGSGECVDGSSYSGIGFTISGDAGPSGTLRMFVRQIGNAGASPMDAYVDVEVTDTPTQIELSWSEFTGGSPVATVTAGEITGLQWDFGWVEDEENPMDPYEVDVVIDDLTFLE